jgi:cell division transport system permease protein
MPWVIAIMMFLSVLAAAAGLGLGGTAESLGEDIGSRVTVQVLEQNPDRREAEARRAVAELGRLPGIADVRRLEQNEMEDLLEPWLGPGGLQADLPIPAMIDVQLDTATPAALETMRTVLAQVAPSARVDQNSQWLAPLAGLISALRWLAVGLVLLMVGATAATVVLAARASLDMHRSTIEVLHLMGATDIQVARLFQRRIALDALFGGIVGFLAAAIALLLIARRVGALGSDLIGSTNLPAASWALLAALPVLGVVLAMLVARATILRALRRML